MLVLLSVTETRFHPTQAAFRKWPITFCENRTVHTYGVNITGATFPYINIKKQRTEGLMYKYYGKSSCLKRAHQKLFPLEGEGMSGAEVVIVRGVDMALSYNDSGRFFTMWISSRRASFNCPYATSKSLLTITTSKIPGSLLYSMSTLAACKRL